jgi:hypothetical protein
VQGGFLPVQRVAQHTDCSLKLSVAASYRPVAVTSTSTRVAVFPFAFR